MASLGRRSPLLRSISREVEPRCTLLKVRSISSQSERRCAQCHVGILSSFTKLYAPFIKKWASRCTTGAKGMTIAVSHRPSA
jgi:hypothetical protein